MVALLTVVVCCAVPFVLGILGLGKNRVEQAPALSQATAVTADSGLTFVQERRIFLHVEGMTCASCEFQVRRALKKLDGVKDAKVSAEEKKAEVVYDAAKTKPEDLINAVNKAGYKASLPDSSTGG